MARARITNKIRRLRFDANEMTQKDLADAVGVTRQTIMAIENAKYFPSLDPESPASSMASNLSASALAVTLISFTESFETPESGLSASCAMPLATSRMTSAST